MSVDIPPELNEFVQSVIRTGRCQNESEVVTEALRLYRELECRRETLRKDIQAGMQGDAIPGEIVFEELQQLAQSIASQSK